MLGAASVYVFGAEPGRLPAQLYDVLARTTDDADRARLAAALARCWAYAGHAAARVQFADEAVERAERVGAPDLLADCLDAALAAHWGPDELDVRRDSGAPGSTTSPRTCSIPTPGCRRTCGGCRWPARRSTCRRSTGRCARWNGWARSRRGRCSSPPRGG